MDESERLQRFQQNRFNDDPYYANEIDVKFNPNLLSTPAPDLMKIFDKNE